MKTPQTFRKAVNRHASGYHAQRISEMSDLDKAASFLLAISYSEKAAPTKVSQGLIQMDCVAVALVNDEWLVASNSRKLEDWHMEELAKEIDESLKYALVKRGNGGMHAEMQVLEEIKASNYSIAGVRIGVSKPCCAGCKAVLDRERAIYTHSHGDKVANWEAPDLS